MADLSTCSECFGIARNGDETLGCGTHYAPCCPHILHGYHIVENTVKTNCRPGTAHLESLTIHDCPHCLYGKAAQGNPTVLVADVCAPVHTIDMLIDEGCGWGITITASPDVITPRVPAVIECPPYDYDVEYEYNVESPQDTQFSEVFG